MNEIPQDVELYIKNIIEHKNTRIMGISCNSIYCTDGKSSSCGLKIIRDLYPNAKLQKKKCFWNKFTCNN
jgi:hypothetical protein